MWARVRFLEGYCAVDHASPPDVFIIYEMVDSPLELDMVEYGLAQGDILVLGPIVEPGESNYGYRQKDMSEDPMDEGDDDSLWEAFPSMKSRGDS